MNIDKPAVVAGGAVVSHGELAGRSTGLASLLRERGVRPGTVVGVCVSHGVELVVSILALWEIGAVYVPLDPELPLARTRFMLADANIAMVVAEERFASWFTGVDVVLPDATTPLAPSAATPSPSLSGMPAELAYIIYTSGSTGRPKGVLVERASLANFVHVVGELAAPAAERRAIWLTSISFDMSFKALGVLYHGGVLHVPPREVRVDPRACVEYMSANRIDLVPCTPSLAVQLIEFDLLRQVGTTEHPLLLWLGGEPISDHLWALLRKTPTVRALNMYGPTECTVDATVCWLHDEQAPSLGKPIANMRIHLLDEAGTPVKQGTTGEICVSGIGLARGYLNQPRLTEERFVFVTLGGSRERVYRTGDMARERAGGALEFVGRVDDQVKVRGHRVELGEVEAQLRKVTGSHDVAVIAAPLPTGELSLRAYLTGKEVPVKNLRNALAAHLPEYMIPAAFVHLDGLPLGTNGKVDRKALGELAAAGTRPNLETGFVAPRNRIEQEVRAVWRDVLGIEDIGVHDDFYAIGGHSLLAVRALARLRHSLGTQIPVHFFFEYRTIATFAEAIAHVVDTSRTQVDIP